MFAPKLSSDEVLALLKREPEASVPELREALQELAKYRKVLEECNKVLLGELMVKSFPHPDRSWLDREPMRTRYREYCIMYASNHDCRLK